MIEENIGPLHDAAQAAISPFHSMAITTHKIANTLEMVDDLSGPQKLELLDMLQGKAIACQEAYTLMQEAYTATEPIEPDEE